VLNVEILYFKCVTVFEGSTLLKEHTHSVLEQSFQYVSY